MIDILPLGTSAVPFALAIGVEAARHDPWLAGWSGSWLIYSGSAHLAAMRLIETNPYVAVLIGLLINTRLVLYSASLAAPWQHQPRWFRLLAAPFIIDLTWAIAEPQAADDPDLRHQRHYFTAAALALGTIWSSAMLVGVLVGNLEISTHHLRIFGPLALVALLAPRLDSRPHWIAAAAASATTFLAVGLPGIDMLAAIVAGTAAGLWCERS